MTGGTAAAAGLSLAEAPPDRRLRIVFLVRALVYGGAERQLVTLARGLHERGHSVSVLVFYPGGPLERDLAAAGIPVRPLEKRGRWDVGGFLWRLVGMLREAQPDVLHGYLEMGNLLAVLLRPLLPRTRIVWGVRVADIDYREYDWLARLNFSLLRYLSFAPDLIVVNSRAGRDHHRRVGFPAETMTVIPNGIDTDRFRRDPDAARRVRAEWGIAQGDVLVGMVGRLDPVKDHPTFLRAAAQLARLRSDVHFVCVGEGPAEYRDRLQRIGRELGIGERLVWAAGRSDMPAVYSALDVLCSASYSEGFSNVIAEAMACGVPCVVTDVGDSAWIVGEGGRVVPPRDPEAMAAALAEQVERSTVGGVPDVRNWIVNRFSVARLLDATEEALWVMG